MQHTGVFPIPQSLTGFHILASRLERVLFLVTAVDGASYLRLWRVFWLSISLLQSSHGRARIGRTAVRPTIVQHRLAKQMNVLAFNLDRQGTRGDELGGPMAVG